MKNGVFFAADNYRKVPRIKDLRLIFKKFPGEGPGPPFGDTLRGSHTLTLRPDHHK